MASSVIFAQLDENVVDVRYCLFTYSRGAKSTLTAVTLCEPLLDSMEASSCSSYALVIHGNALIFMEEFNPTVWITPNSVTVQAVEKDGVKVQEKVKSHLHRGNCKAMHRYNWSQTSIDAATKGTSFPFKHILVSKFPNECTYPCAGTGYQLNSLPRPTSHLRCSTLASALRNLLTITVHAPQPDVKTFKHLTFEEMALLLDPSVGWGTWQVEPCLKCFWSPPSPHPSLVPHNLNFVLEILIDGLSLEDIFCKSFVVNQVLIWT